MKLPTTQNACVLILLAFVLAGCETSDTAARPDAGPASTGADVGPASGGATAAGAGSGATATGTRVARTGAQAPLEPGRGSSGEWVGGPLGTLVIYFDYDRSAIREEYSEVLQAHGAWLAANPASSVRLEGHADERGTPEYNLALGSRRAQSVARALAALGAGDGQWSMVSFGEEKPAEYGSDEGAWSQNRRVELVYE